MAGVGEAEDFWNPVFKEINERLNLEEIDSYIQMNLLWSLARTHNDVDKEIKDEISHKVIENLKKEIGNIFKDYNQKHMMHFLPNLVWSTYTLEVSDPDYWKSIL